MKFIKMTPHKTFPYLTRQKGIKILKMKKGLDQQEMHHYRTSTFHILYMFMRLQIPFLVFIYIFFSTGMGVHGVKSSKHWLTIPSAIFFIFNRIAQQQVKNV